MDLQFVADVHLGKLARKLRMLGIDTVYRNDLTLPELLRLSSEEGRILLSRNPSLEKIAGGLAFFLIKSEDPAEQLRALLQQFDLAGNIHPFTRCMHCNGQLEPVAKEKIKDQAQPNTLLYYHEFWQCPRCKKIYWKGSHYQRMLAQLDQLNGFTQRRQ